MKIRPCSTCKTKPQCINDRYGIRYQCPQCHKRATHWADNEAAADSWNMMNGPGVPAGCGEIAKGLLKWA